jgi:hypothetical protein
MYTIHGHDGVITKPCIFILMCGQIESVYKTIFRQVHALFLILVPQHITLDYEIAAIRAFRCVFHGVVICGCSFHFNQSIWRAVQRNCLAALYHSEISVKMQVARLFALPYMPEEHVIHAFRTIKTEADQRLTNVIKYFERQFIGIQRPRRNVDPVFQPDLWNLYQRTIERVPKTNNAVESWHNTFLCIQGWS